MMTNVFESPLMRTATYLIAIGFCIAALLLLPNFEPDRSPVFLYGIYDWFGHLLTAVVAAIGIRALRFPVSIWPVLLGGVVLDLGYAPQNLGYIDAIGASGRNASHSFVAVSTLASIGFLDRRHANIWLGIAIGAVTHLWRDMGTGTVPLMWPITDMVYGTSHMRYIAGLTGMAIAMVGSGALLDVDAQARGGEPTM